MAGQQSLSSFMNKLAEKNMKIPQSNLLFLVLLFFVASIAETRGESITCFRYSSPCFMRRIQCPYECNSKSPSDPNAKVCSINCNSPLCQAECKKRKPDCNGLGAACHDPRFIAADGTVFYFHGKKNEHFSLVSDHNLQINARFIGLRPAGRPRDYTWIQALGILFDSRTFSAEAIKATAWDDEVDHLKLSFDEMELEVPEMFPSVWEARGYAIKVERASKNSAVITIPEVAEISVNIVPVTKEDDRIHNYQIPSDDCFAHLEVQFRFLGLSSNVEGVLGRTYQPDFVSPAKPGVAMPVVGGEDKYRTTSLLSTDCKKCIFSPSGILRGEDSIIMNYGTLDCTSGGNGIVCRK